MPSSATAAAPVAHALLIQQLRAHIVHLPCTQHSGCPQQALLEICSSAVARLSSSQHVEELQGVPCKLPGARGVALPAAVIASTEAPASF